MNKDEHSSYVVKTLDFRRACKITKSGYQRHVCQSVRMEQHGFQLMKCDILVFFGKLSRKCKFHWNMTRIIGTLHGELCTFISRHWSESEECFGQKLQGKSAYLLCSVTFFENRAVFWGNEEKSCRSRQPTDGYIIWTMHFACWITKAIDTYSEYVTITAFPRQLLRELTALLLLRIRILPVFLMRVYENFF
jgi:hypothetical protein